MKTIEKVLDKTVTFKAKKIKNIQLSKDKEITLPIDYFFSLECSPGKFLAKFKARNGYGIEEFEISKQTFNTLRKTLIDHDGTVGMQFSFKFKPIGNMTDTIYVLSENVVKVLYETFSQTDKRFKVITTEGIFEISREDYDVFKNFLISDK